jgi:hypothetical protein
MLKSEKNTRDAGCLTLRGYRVVALKPEFDEQTIKLEREIQEGVPAFHDPARPDFYDVALEDGWWYIHVYPERRVVYLVGKSPSTHVDFPLRSEDIRILEESLVFSAAERRQISATAGGLGSGYGC